MAGRHKNANKQNPRGTGKPDPNKDRTAHEAKRGTKKVTPEQLASEIPGAEYLNSLKEHVLNESDRGAVVMCGAMVEQALKEALCRKLSHLTAEETSQWFDGPLAPFRSFEAKIKLGRGLEIYDGSVEIKLNLVRKLRNVFAHRSLPLDLENEGLAETYADLLADLGEFPALSRREIFAGFALGVTMTLNATTFR
jgi:hypothetical protein